MRTIPGMHEFMKPVDDVIRLELLAALLNSIVPEVDRQLYSLPLRHGGLGMPILSEIIEFQFEASQVITLPITITQGNTLPNKTEVNEIQLKITNDQEVRISEQVLKVGQDQTLHTLPHVSKVFERIIHKQITNYMTEKLAYSITGFRKSHDTQNSLVVMLRK